MELRHLQHFVALAEEQSFTRAAARVSIAQSGLSVSVKTLEEEVGTPLFVRGRGGVQLTPAGEAMLPDARRALAAVDAARRRVDETRGLLRGRLQVGIAHPPDSGKLARVVNGFHRQFPAVRIHVAQAANLDLMDRLADGSLDLVACGEPLELPHGVRTVPLARSPLTVAVAVDHPLAQEQSVKLAELAGQPFVELHPRWAVRQYADRAFESVGVVREVAAELTDVGLLLNMVAGGLGAAIVPRLVQRMNIPVAVLATDPPLGDWQFVAAHLGDEPANPAARAFLSLLLEEWLGS